jgi:polyferredoxin
MKQSTVQRGRRFTQIAFFVLFVVTPIFDLLRYDLTEAHAWFLGFAWHVGIDDVIAGHVSPLAIAGKLLLYLFLPLLGALGVLLGVAWKWGRLYCGWLCPHFSVVETINRLLLRATGKHSLWDSKKTPPWEPDGRPAVRDARYWLLIVPLVVAFAFTWALVFLTYLMPPFQVYGGLLNFSLYKYEVIFLAVATTVLSGEFLFARHLFCRYACAIGIWQSFAWMGNKKAMVVGFDRERVGDCADCVGGKTSACDAVCPMRLKPRNVKRWMFACTQCGQCLSACATVNRDNAQGPLLKWVSGEAARQNEAGFNAVTLKRLRQMGATENDE